jgi:ATP-binding cassette subfamily A (ABC1) protein 3
MCVEDLCLDLTYERNHGVTCFFQQFCAMLLKRIIHTWNNRLVTAVQLLVPLGFTIVICRSIKTEPKLKDPKPLLFSLDQFKTPISPYSLYNVTNGDIAYDLSRVYSSYLSRQDISTPVVNDTRNNGTHLFIEEYLVNASLYDLQTYIKSYLTAATFESNVAAPENTNDTWTTRFWSYFNNEAYHSPAISLNIFSNTLMQYFANTSFDIHTINHPLPRFNNVKVKQTIAQQQLLGSSVSLYISFGMAFLMATFILFLVKERASGAKHLQFVAGVHVTNFWMSTFVWDFINFMIPSILLLAVFAGFQLDAYSQNSG